MNYRIGLFRNFYVILVLLILLGCSEKDPVGIKWKFEGAFKDPSKYSRTNFSGPIITDNIVYFGTNGQLYALDLETGGEKWKFRAIPQYGPRFFIMSDELIGVWSYDNLYAIDAKTGQQKWVFKCKEKFSNVFIVAYNIVYIGIKEGLSGQGHALPLGMS